MPKKTAKNGGSRGPSVGPDGKSRPLTVSVPEKITAAMDRRRKKEKLTRSAAVTAALREWLAG